MTTLQSLRQKSAELLRVTTNNKLKLEEHIPVLCKKRSLKLNAIGRLQKYLDKKQNRKIKSETSYRKLKECIDTLFDPQCYCTYCKIIQEKPTKLPIRNTA